MQTNRYNGYPAMKLTCEPAPGYSSGEALDEMQRLAAQLPPGFRIEMGGTVDESAKGEKSIQAVMPLMVVGVVTLLMM